MIESKNSHSDQPPEPNEEGCREVAPNRLVSRLQIQYAGVPRNSALSGRAQEYKKIGVADNDDEKKQRTGS